MTETKPIYLGEAQLIRWGHNGTSGKTVTIELPADLPRHPFDGLPIGKESGQRMQVVFVAMDDHEQPLSVDQAIANAARLKGKKGNGTEGALGTAPCVRHAGTSEGSEKPRTPKKRSSLAYLMCQDKAFQDWILDQPFVRGAVINHHAFKDQADITDWLLKRGLNVTSKSELDTDPEAAARFDALRTDYELRDMVR